MKHRTEHSRRDTPASGGTGTAGFTLIELLTVIAILGILAAILIPITGQVRASARQSQCASNMRQIGLALRLYADEHDGRLPQTAHSDVSQSWIFSLEPYLDDINEIRICPSDPRADEKREKDDATSYIANDLIFTPAENEFGQVVGEDFRRLDLLHAPSQTMLAFIGADNRGMTASDDHTHAVNWANNWTAVINDIAPDRHRTGPRSPDRTNGSANYLFADGHVERISALDIRKRVEAGENIALPPEAG